MSNYVVDRFLGMNEVLSPDLLDEKNGISCLLENADVTNGKLCGARGDEELPCDDPVYYRHYGNENRSVVKWYGRTYWSDNFTGGCDGHEEPLGVPYPKELPQLEVLKKSGDEKGLTGDYEYCICFVNENGWESAPGEEGNYYSKITLSESWCKVTVPVFPDGIRYAKVYRTAGHGADFFYVGDVETSGGTLEDKTDDITLAMLDPLESLNNYPPPEHGKYLTESGGVFFLAQGDRLYFSNSGDPHSWPRLNFIAFDADITGILREFQGVLVFTTNDAYKVTGAENPETIVKTVIPGHPGCPNWRTMGSVANTPLWVSNTGLCLWDGQNITVVSRQVMRLEDVPVLFAVGTNDEYFLAVGDGVLIYDLRNGGTFRRLSREYSFNYAWYDGDMDKIYVQRWGKLFWMKRGTRMQWHYRSGLIGTKLISYDYLELRLNSTEGCRVRFLVDGEERGAVNLRKGKQKVKLPFRLNGAGMQLDITGTGQLTAYAVSY